VVKIGFDLLRVSVVGFGCGSATLFLVVDFGFECGSVTLW